MARSPSSPRGILWIALVFALFVLADLGLFGWLIFRSLSQREVNQVILEAQTEAEVLAAQIAGEANRFERDLYTAVATQSETRSYIEDVLLQREIVEVAEVYDSEGRLVVRHQRTDRQGSDEELPEGIDLTDVVTESIASEPARFQEVRVPVGDMGTFVIGLRREEIEGRLSELRSDLLNQASLIALLTLVLFVTGYFLFVRVLRRSRQLEVQAAEAEQLALVGTLASGLAHEIRSPLNSLNLNMQMLEEDSKIDSSDRRILQLTRSEIGRLERLVTDFLSFARPRSMEVETVEAAAPLRRAEQLLAARIRARGVELEVIDTAEGEQVEVDRGQIHQLLLNLIDNALEASLDGNAQPRIELEAESRGDRVLLSVGDNGRGMTPEQVERAFDVFFSERKGGTGLGLAIVQRIASDHRGRISIDSAPGEGTRVTLSLPRARRAQSAPIASRSSEVAN
ncbi:MAG: ATP-binding protein [Acidobacteriota bacterium]